MHGAGEVVGVDLSEGSLAVARERQAESNLDTVTFRSMDILNCDLHDVSVRVLAGAGRQANTPPSCFSFRGGPC